MSARGRWLLSLVALGATALALFYWQTSSPSTPESATATDAGQPPQIIIHGLTRLTTSEQGVWLSTVRAVRADYYEQSDELHLSKPDIQGEDRDPYRITAETALLQDSHLWTLEQNVVLTNNPEHDAPVHIHTDYLEYDTLSDTAQTSAPVRIEQPGRMLTTATGMVFELDTQEYELHEQVRSRYQPAGN